MRKIVNYSVAVSLLLCAAITPVRAADPLSSILGALIATPISTVSGLLRGSVAKGSEYSNTFSDELGGGTFGQVVGVPTGMVTGVVTGGVTGLMKGLINGIIVGVDKPFTAESMSLDGEFTDYDPYHLDPH